MPGANIVAACLAKRVGQPSPVILAGYTKSGHSKPALNASLLAIVDPPDSVRRRLRKKNRIQRNKLTPNFHAQLRQVNTE